MARASFQPFYEISLQDMASEGFAQTVLILESLREEGIVSLHGAQPRSILRNKVDNHRCGCDRGFGESQMVHRGGRLVSNIRSRDCAYARRSATVVEKFRPDQTCRKGEHVPRRRTSEGKLLVD